MTSHPIRVMIADDEPRARQFLEKLLAEYQEVELVGSARGGIEALKMIEEEKPEVAFLDIHMPDLSGLEVARHLKEETLPLVVFVTAYDRYAVEAFEVAALDYVLKPLKRERLGEAWSRARDEIRSGRRAARAQAVREALDQPQLRDALPPLTRLPVRHRREVKLLEFHDVPLIFSRDRLVLARAEGHEYLVDYTLQELEARLPKNRFVRAHRNALVNIESVDSYASEDGTLKLKLKDGTQVEASERKAAEVRRRLR